MSVSVGVGVVQNLALYFCVETGKLEIVRMFDFENLQVYQKANELNISVLKYLHRTKNIDPFLKDQLKRATLSIVLNLAEGTGRITQAEKKRFYTIARSSVFECVAILEVLKGCQILDVELFGEYYLRYEELSKMLLSLYRNAKSLNTRIEK